jgi:hypothetical protein
VSASSLSLRNIYMEGSLIEESESEAQFPEVESVNKIAAKQ